MPTLRLSVSLHELRPLERLTAMTRCSLARSLSRGVARRWPTGRHAHVGGWWGHPREASWRHRRHRHTRWSEASRRHRHARWHRRRARPTTRWMWPGRWARRRHRACAHWRFGLRLRHRRLESGPVLDEVHDVLAAAVVLLAARHGGVGERDVAVLAVVTRHLANARARGAKSQGTARSKVPGTSTRRTRQKQKCTRRR